MAKFRNVLQSKGMSDIIIALREAICVFHLRNNERGAISSDRKYNSLSGRWFVKDNNGGIVTPSTSSSCNGAQKFIERNVHVKLPVQDGNSPPFRAAYLGGNHPKDGKKGSLVRFSRPLLDLWLNSTLLKTYSSRNWDTPSFLRDRADRTSPFPKP
ncbi:hypothetical protein ACHAXM_005378 [Skeletonema potamos]